MDRIDDVFLRGTALERVIQYFCETNIGHVMDPINDVLCLMLTTPLQPTITESGVSFFRNRSTFVLPYSHMTQSQIDYTREVVREFTNISSPSAAARAGVQMGGGCVIRASREYANQKSKPQNETNGNTRTDFLDPYEVVASTCKLVFNSKDHTDPALRYNICNIILQRVQSTVHLSKEVQQKLFAVIENLKHRS